jgi:translation initiation factor 6
MHNPVLRRIKRYFDHNPFKKASLPGRMHVIKTSFRGNPNVGLYIYVTDTYCLVGPEIAEDEYPRLEKVFEVPVHRCTIAGTGLLGVFMAGNNKHTLVPGIITGRERQLLEKLHIPFTIIETDLTALGNNILVNDNGCLISDEYPEAERKAIEKALGLKAKPIRIGELPIIGSCAVANNKGCLLHRGAQEFELEMIQDTLGVPVTKGTLNLGNPYVKGGCAANSKGMIVGDLSGGPEIVNAEEALRG